MKKIILCLCTFAFIIVLSSCGYEYDGEGLLGTWREKGIDEGSYSVYNFYSDKEVSVTYYKYGIVYSDEYCYYEITDGNKITIINGDTGRYELYTFKIKKDKLTIKRGSIKINLEKYESDYNKDENIFGTWKDTQTGETYFFGENHLGMFYNTKLQGREFAYSTRNGILYFPYTSSFIVPIEYRIDGNRLYFEVDGEVYGTFERVEK